MPAYIDYFIYISLTKPYPDHSGIAEFVGAVALWQQSWFLRSLERLNQIIDQWSFTRVCEGLLLSPPQHALSKCSLLFIPLTVLTLTFTQRNCHYLSSDSNLMQKESCTVLQCSIPQLLPCASHSARGWEKEQEQNCKTRCLLLEQMI